MSAPRVTLARVATDASMGQQLAETWLIAALRRRATTIDVRELGVTAVRSTLPADRRLPIVRLQSLPWPIQRGVGGVAYRGAGLIHRLDPDLPPGRRPEVLTIHDLAPLHFRDEGHFPPNFERSLHHAHTIVCPSHFSAAEVADVYGVDNATVIPNGLDPLFLDPPTLTHAQRSSLGLPERWVLHVGGATDRKNLAALAAAWPTIRQVHPDTGLVMCGPPHPARTALFPSTGAGVFYLGQVERPLLVALVAAAAAVVVPSTYEGYGLPVLEAMACGVPVVVADAGALAEVAGRTGVVVEPTSDGIAAGITTALGGLPADRLRDGAAAARVQTWDAAADAHLRLYADLLERG